MCPSQIGLRYYDLISKFQVGLKSLLCQGLGEPDFYGDLVYKLKKIVGSNSFSAQFIKIISHYKKIGYNINVLQQTACLVVNPITIGNFAFIFNCTPVGRIFRLYDGSDLQTYLLMRWWGPDALVFCRAHRGLPVGFLLLRYSVLFTVESLSLLYLLVIS